MKAVSRLAAEHAADWRPLHAAVLGCLLAHRNRRSGNCWPKRRLIAAHCNVSERTVDRAIDQLVAWGALEKQQPRALVSRQFREAQYTFLFETPTPVEKGCELERKSCANQPEPCDKIAGGRATKSARAVRQNRGPYKERRERSEEKDLKGKSPSHFSQSGFSQSDFDARDLRRMAKAMEFLGKHNSEGISRAGQMTTRQWFEAVCEIAGVTIARGLELDRRRREWPADAPDWAREKSG